MKRLFFLTALIFLGPLCSYAQLLNGDFAVNNGNDESFNGCPTFSNGTFPFINGSVLNWIRTHGTPSLDASHQIFLFNTGTTGEGIAALFPFQAGKAYCITVVLADANMNGGTFHVEATNGPFSVGDPNNCGTAIPSVTSTPIKVWNDADITGAGTFHATFFPTSNFAMIWLFPVGVGTPQTDVRITSVDVTETCVDELFFINGLVNPNTYLAQHIYAGTSLPGGGPNIVVNDPDAFTHFKSGQSVELVNNFAATANSGGAFLATATYYNCFCGFVGKPGREDNSNNQLSNIVSNATIRSKNPVATTLNDSGQVTVMNVQSIVLFPTPAANELNISLIYSDLVSDIQVFDMDGRLLPIGFVRQTPNRYMADVSNLTAGIYIVKIQTAEGVTIKRFIKS